MWNYSNIVKGYLFTPFLFLLLLSNQLFAESHEKTSLKIIERKEIILSASKKFDVNPAYLSAIIYTERTKNFDWTDEAFDEAIARVGQNSSLGFAQVKMKTAYYIERQLSDSTSDFYCGKKYENILGVSKTPYLLIEKLKNDSTNILYATAYLRIIQSFWSKNGYSIDDRPEIIGSLYQLGLFYPSGKVREPHFNPRPNEFGEKVKESIELFNSFKNRNNVFFYKKKVIMKNRILVLLLSLLFVSCDILSPEESLPFPWVKRDTELIYNYYSNTDTIFSALSIKFLLNPDNNLRMVYDYNNGYNNGLLNSSIGNSFLIFKENDGLYASTPVSCVPPSFKSTKFLRVPSKPKLNKLYPQYVCGDIGFSLEVIGIDTVITVPSGSYNVFLLNDMSHSIIEYWSEKHGLIRMLCFNKNDSTYFAYELISIKY